MTERRKKGSGPMPGQVFQRVDSRLAKAFNHPVRTEIVAVMQDGEYSPKRLSEILEMPLANVSYHIDVLAKLGLVELTRTQPKRGANEHFYRATSLMYLDDKTWPALDPATKDAVSVNTVNESFRLVSEAFAGGTFDSKDERAAVNWALSLDEQGWHELAKMTRDYLDGLARLREDAINRTPDPTKRFRANVTLLSYELPPRRGDERR